MQQKLSLQKQIDNSLIVREVAHENFLRLLRDNPDNKEHDIMLDKIATEIEQLRNGTYWKIRQWRDSGLFTS